MEREGSMASWVWKAQLGAMVGLLLVWGSPPFFFLPCDCMTEVALQAEGQPKLKDYIRDPERFKTFFPPWIDTDTLPEKLPVNGTDGEFGKIAVGAGTGSKEKLGREYVKRRDGEEEEVCLVVVGSAWPESVNARVLRSTNAHIKSHLVEPKHEWLYPIPNTVKGKKYSCKNSRLEISQRNTVPGHNPLVTFLISKPICKADISKADMPRAIQGGLTTNLSSDNFLLTKVLLSERDKGVRVEYKDWGKELGEHGEGRLQMMYRLDDNGRLARKVFAQIRWSKFLPNSFPEGNQNCANVKGHVMDLWVYSDENPEDDPTRILEGKHSPPHFRKYKYVKKGRGPVFKRSKNDSESSKNPRSGSEDSEDSEHQRRVAKKRMING